MSSAHKNINDEIREQTRKFRDMTPKQKLSYFWTYYKIPTLIIIAAVFFVVTFTRDYIESSKETMLYAVLINANTMNDYTGLSEDFAAYAGIDLTEKHVSFDASIQSGGANPQIDVISTQKMAAMISAGSLDVVLASESDFIGYVQSGFFFDLRTVLPQDMLDAYSDSFYYYAHDQEAAAATGAAVGMSPAEIEELAHDLGPYDTLEPVPVGIRLETLDRLPANTFLGTEPIIWGVCVNSSHPDQAIQFLQFLEEE